jgi:dienelactone hydrolase
VTEPSSVVEDISTEDGIDYFLVRPTTRAATTGMLALHWFDESPTANRAQFLDEAKRLAEHGVVSLLPQLTFPWQSPPTDIESDLTRISVEVERLRTCHAVLAGVAGVDPTRIAMVGHDFGAMHGMLLFGEVELCCAVMVAPTPRWADWFLRFWPIDSDRFDYMRALSAVDPINVVERATCPLLFQFGKQDFYIAAMTGSELFNAAPEPKQILVYDADHAMGLGEIEDDRIDFLVKSMDLAI